MQRRDPAPDERDEEWAGWATVGDPTREDGENALLLEMVVTRALRDAPDSVRQVAFLLAQDYREAEIAQLLRISRQKVWRLREHVRRLLEQYGLGSKGGEQIDSVSV